MRILMTVPSLAREFGGPVAKAKALAEALRRHGHDVALVGAGVADDDRAVGLGQLGSFHATPFPARLRQLRHLVRGADVVHVIGFRDPVGTAAWRAADSRNVPMVLEPTGMVRPRVRSFTLKRTFDTTLGRLVLRSADKVIATSSIETDDLVRSGVTRDRIAIRANGIAVDELLPLPARGQFRNELGITDAPLILVIARLAAIKGLHRFLGAIVRLPAMQAVIAGPDEGDGTLERLRAAAQERSLGDRVHLLPTGLWGSAKAQALADADVFCLPSDYESFGSAAAEAACVGLPVVVTDRCGVKDVLDPTASVVVNAFDQSQLADGIADALFLRSGAADAASSLRRRLDWSTLAEEQIKIYERLRR